MIRQVAKEKIGFTRLQMPCGTSAVLNDLTNEEITLAEMFGVSRENLLCCPATGDSMIDEGIACGDILFADSSLIAKQGDIVLAEIDGEMAVKKIENKFPHLRLVSCNSQSNYAPVNPQYGFHVVGVIVGSFRFRK
ncbi:MAG: hypothetical protein M3367_03335 [Acidobacteriota bacterium]|nr:hypothetical protein [Acidobacteriota bacterium]